MKYSKTMMKKVAVALLAGASLSGCVAVPYGEPSNGPAAYGEPTYGQEAYYGQQGYGQPVLIGPAVVVAPPKGFDLGDGGRGRR